MSTISFGRSHWSLKEGAPACGVITLLSSIHPEIIGVSERVGSLEVGKDADLVLLSGHPLDYRSLPELVLIDGKKEYESTQLLTVL